MQLFFVGSTEGMTHHQKKVVKEFLEDNKDSIDRILHGDGRGADEEFHGICHELGLINKIYIHPLNKREKRALCKSPYIAEPTTYYLRKKELLKKASFLLAATSNYQTNPVFGCWPMVDAAKEKPIPVLIIFPDGTIRKVNHEKMVEGN